MVEVKDGKEGRFMTSRSIDNFSRQPIEFDGKMQIASRCNQCGTRIIGSIHDGLEDKETDHLKKCFRATRSALSGQQK
jgi:hypothetical protein